MELVDSHCHIHEADPAFTADFMSAQKWRKADDTDVAAIVARAAEAEVTKMLCIGTTLVDSQQAIVTAGQFDNVWTTIGIHPHEAAAHNNPTSWQQFAQLATAPKVVGVGECGLDYYYGLSPKADQVQLLRLQIELALEHNLPLLFHTRDAFTDFWPIFDSYQGIRGVLHSFTDSADNLARALERGLYVGVNGIATFAKDPAQLAMYRSIPGDHLLLETDAPFLTPHPYRGTICEPKHVRVTAEFLAQLRDEPVVELAAATSRNAHDLFGV